VFENKCRRCGPAQVVEGESFEVGAFARRRPVRRRRVSALCRWLTWRRGQRTQPISPSARNRLVRRSVRTARTFSSHYGNGTVSTIDVKNRTKDPADIPVGMGPTGASVTPCRRWRAAPRGSEKVWSFTAVHSAAVRASPVLACR